MEKKKEGASKSLVHGRVGGKRENILSRGREKKNNIGENWFFPITKRPSKLFVKER